MGSPDAALLRLQPSGSVRGSLGFLSGASYANSGAERLISWPFGEALDAETAPLAIPT